jgi:hypothetical protein
MGSFGVYPYVHNLYDDLSAVTYLIQQLVALSLLYNNDEDVSA